MKLSDLDTFIRMIVRPATKKRIDPTQMRVLLNKSKDDIAAQLGLYKKNKDFTLENGVSQYELSSIADDYLKIDDSGIFVLDDNSQWKQLDPYTKAKLDEEFPYWRNHESSDPLRYYIEANCAVLDPAPDEDTSDGGRLYYCAKPPDMSNNDHYPFPSLSDQTVEIPLFSILDECIFKYMEWILLPMVMQNEEQKEIVKYQEYSASIQNKRSILYGRADIAANQYTMMKGPQC